MNTHWQDLIQQYVSGTISPADSAALEQQLKSDPVLRDWYLDALNLDTALETAAEFAETALRLPVPPSVQALSLPEKRSSRRLAWRPLWAAAAGIVLGMLGTSVVFGYAMPRAVATASRLFALVDGSFEKATGRVASGFPVGMMTWSGDEAELVKEDVVKATDGRQMLRFVSPGADAKDPNGPAMSCDVFQLVDLRPLREQVAAQGDSVLELSASFLDARGPNTKPSVTFFCQMYLFRGDPAAMHQTWPKSITDALSSSSAQITTLGQDGKGWLTLSAKCLLSADADFAVVQIAARPNLRPAKLELLFADDVRLTLKTSPTLPIRVVQQ